MQEHSEQIAQRAYGFRLTKAGLARLQLALSQEFPEVKAVALLVEALNSKVPDGKGPNIKRNTLRRILQLDKNNSTVKQSSIRELFEILQLELTDADLEMAKDSPAEESPDNPFLYPLPIRDSDDFWGRTREIKVLAAAHHRQRPYQIYGERKIGKSSLLEYCRRNAADWGCQPVFLNGLETSEAGLCKRIADELGLEDCKTIGELFPKLEARLGEADGVAVLYPAIYVDDFDVFKSRINQIFGDDENLFWSQLRSTVDHLNLRFIVTTIEPFAPASEGDRELSQLKGIVTSMRLQGFTEKEADEILNRTWNGFTFNPTEKERILDQARRHDNHPMALQIICSSVFDARIDGLKLDSALKEAESEILRRITRAERLDVG